jgi:photosystem II stability/assembly factor-like uncharacterized protein
MTAGSFRLELFSPRELRAALAVVAALATLAAAALAYARPAPPRPAPAAPRAVVRFMLSPSQGWEVLDQQHNHVYRTLDGGRTWSPDGGLPDGVVLRLAFTDPENGEADVREDSATGLLHRLVSVDGGAHWEEQGRPLP